MKNYLFLIMAAYGFLYADGLTLNDCVNTALENNKDITALKSAYEASIARTNQVRAAYYPQVNGSLGFSRSVTPLSLSFGSSFPNMFLW